MTHPRIVHDAKEMAGEFYERDRSDTFRASWPDQMEYVNLKWPHFVAPVRAAYAEILSRPDVEQEDKDKLFEALISDAEAGSNSDGAASPIPIIPGTQSFDGDRFDNRRINEIFGRQKQSVAKRLRTTTALFPN